MNNQAVRYLLFKETPCPSCGGDGRALSDDGLCTTCQGDKVVRVQVGVIPDPVAQILVSQFGVVQKASQGNR